MNITDTYYDNKLDSLIKQRDEEIAQSQMLDDIKKYVKDLLHIYKEAVELNDNAMLRIKQLEHELQMANILIQQKNDLIASGEAALDIAHKMIEKYGDYESALEKRENDLLNIITALTEKLELPSYHESLFADAIRKCAITAGIVNEGITPTGPELLLLAQNVVEMLEILKSDNKVLKSLLQNTDRSCGEWFRFR